MYDMSYYVPIGILYNVFIYVYEHYTGPSATNNIISIHIIIYYFSSGDFYVKRVHVLYVCV